MRLVYMGSPACAIGPLEHLLSTQEEHGHEVLAVVSQPAKLVGRGRKKKPTDPPVAQFAKEKGIPCLQPEKASQEDFLNELKNLNIDVIVTCAYGQILTQKFLDIPGRGTINIHPSRLPEYRGATPVQAALLNGDKDTAVTVLFTVKALDAGNIISQKDFPIDPKERYEELIFRLFKEGGPLLVDALEKLKDSSFVGIPQDEDKVSKCIKFSKEDGLIKWEDKLDVSFNRYRAFFPWPGSFCFLGDHRLVVEEMDILPLGSYEDEEQAELGANFLDKKRKGIRVKVADGWLLFKRVKPAGSKSMEATSFWNGFLKK